MLSDRIINVHFLVGGYLCCGTIFQKYSTTQRFAGENVKRRLKKLALLVGGGMMEDRPSYDIKKTAYIFSY